MSMYNNFLEEYPEVLTPYEVMEILGIGKNLVYQMLIQGDIKGVRLGKVWRIPKNSLRSIFNA